MDDNQLIFTEDYEVFMRDKIRSVLIECRKEKKLTQTDVGQLVGKSKTAVASWEQGKSLPDAATLYALARYYGKTIEYMYGEGGTNHEIKEDDPV